MAPLGSVRRTRGQLCNLPGPRLGPVARVLFLGVRDSLQESPVESHRHSRPHGDALGAPCTPPKSESGRLSKRPTFQTALAPHTLLPGLRVKGPRPILDSEARN